MERMPIAEAGDPAELAHLGASLSARGPLAGIAPDTIAAVARAGALLELTAGEFLVREGEPATPEVYVLLEGTLGVQSKGTFIARLDQAGAVIGEVAVVLSSKRTADVIAESSVRALAIPVAVLGQPEFADVAAGIRGAMLRDDWVQY
jgi:CRP-like cAMP-binding protein